MKLVKENTIEQLLSLKDNSLSFVEGDDIWKRDVEAIDNAIEIINAYQQLIKRVRDVKDGIC